MTPSGIETVTYRLVAQCLNELWNGWFCPDSVLICSVRVSEQTSIISLYSINWLIFTTVKVCVYCAVRTGSLSIKMS